MVVFSPVSSSGVLLLRLGGGVFLLLRGCFPTRWWCFPRPPSLLLSLGGGAFLPLGLQGGARGGAAVYHLLLIQLLSAKVDKK